MKKLNVKLKDKSYDIHIERGILKHEEFLKYIQRINEKIIIVTEDKVNKLYANSMYEFFIDNNIEAYIISMKGGENNKNHSTVIQIYKELINLSADRNSCLIALGGGIVGDIVGFVASTYMRGVKFIQIPTTFLSQVDSSIGGKVGVNMDEGKNLIGAFYHPKKVIIDIDTIDTLEEKRFMDGVSEAIKYGAIKNNHLFEFFEKNNSKDIKEHLEDIIFNCLDIKRDIVERDERECDARKLLNFGHTIGHGIEGYYEYKKYTHGEAVAIGMYIISKIGEVLKVTKGSVSDRIKNTLIKYNMPFYDNITDIEKLMNIISKDKKSHGDTIDIILLKDIGDGMVYSISKDTLKINLNRVFKDITKGEGYE